MRQGFTIIELVIVVGILALLAATSILILNPADQLAKARNDQRRANLNLILNAVGQNIADNTGGFNCASGAVPSATTTMADNNPIVGDYNIAPCLVSAYLQTLPFDPALNTAYYANNGDYNTGYTIKRDPVTGRITVSAPGAELGEAITVAR